MQITPFPLGPQVSEKATMLPLVPGLSGWKTNYSRIKHGLFKASSSHRTDSSPPALKGPNDEAPEHSVILRIALCSVTSHQIQGMSILLKPVIVY